MAHESVTHEVSGQNEKTGALGPILCWAVVFADIGSSIYYAPGILSGTTDGLVGFFVLLIMPVFLLLALKYTEVTDRFPDGGGAVTVTAQTINPWLGALAGMLLLVGYFSTAAISCLSSVHYLGLVIPAVNQPLMILCIPIVILILLGIFNWAANVKVIARVALIGSIIAFASDLAIITTVFTHISFSDFFSLFLSMYKKQVFTPFSVMIGFSSAFLVIAGLESISQLSPVLKYPRKRVAQVAILLIVFTIVLTSPLLTILSTTLLPKNIVDDSVLSSQVISLLAGHFGGLWGQFLQVEVAISASGILIIAGNTAIVCTDRVFMALSRLEFFPSFVLRRNRLRGTRHYSVALAVGVPIVILIIVLGNSLILGEIYTFGLLGAFTFTCLGLDIVRYREHKRERKAARAVAAHLRDSRVQAPSQEILRSAEGEAKEHKSVDGPAPNGGLDPETFAILGVPLGLSPPARNWRTRLRDLWYKLNFWLGILTTLLVALSWITVVIAKPQATAFGSIIVTLGMGIAYVNYVRLVRKERLPVPVVSTSLEEIPDCILAILTTGNDHNTAIVRTTVKYAGENEKKSAAFLYVGNPPGRQREPTMFEIIDPYLDDSYAKECFGEAERLAQLAIGAKRFIRRYFYLQEEQDAIKRAWQTIRPRDTVIAPENVALFKNVFPVSIMYEVTPDGEVAHLLTQ